MAAATPPKKATSTSAHDAAWPVAPRRASAAAKNASPTVVVMSHQRRSSRSARAPPTGESTPIGMNTAAATTPLHRGLWVRCVTTYASTTDCIHEPTLETNADDHTSAKLRDRSGRSE